MSKHFEDFQAKAENYSDYEKTRTPLDHTLFVDDTPPEEIRKQKLIQQAMTALSTGGLSLLTAPFTTTQISLQLSILSHQNKFATVKDTIQNQLSKIPQEYTPQEKRRFELMIRSGVLGYNKPFRAPIYSSYREAFQAIANQGLLGLYKGNFLGLLHAWSNSFLRFQAFNFVESFEFKSLSEGDFFVKAAYESVVLTLVDIVTHPIQLMQSRFILQNRLPNFALYQSSIHFLKKHLSNPRTIFQGWAVHLPKNILFSIGQYNLLTERPFEGYLLSNFIAQTIAYPLTTVLRRLHCQDNLPGMLPKKYTGVLNALKTMVKEEGPKSLFRGYLAFSVVQLFSTLLVLSMSNQAGMAEIDFSGAA